MKDILKEIYKEQNDKRYKRCGISSLKSFLRKSRYKSMRTKLKLFSGMDKEKVSIEGADFLGRLLDQMKYLSLYDTIFDAKYFYTLYFLSVACRNESNLDYKIAAVLNFVALLGPYWVYYSGLLSVRNSQNLYQGEVKSKWGKFSNFMFLTFWGPLKSLYTQVVLAFGDLLTIPAHLFFRKN